MRHRVCFLIAVISLSSPFAVRTECAEPTREQVLDEARITAKLIPDFDEQAMAIDSLLSQQAGAGQFEAARRTAASIASEPSRIRALEWISYQQAKAGDADGVRATLAAVKRKNASITESLVVALTVKGDFPEARTVSEQITDPFYKAHADEVIAIALAAHGDAAEGQKQAAMIGVTDIRATAYISIAEGQFTAGKKAQGMANLGRAREAMKASPVYLVTPIAARMAAALVRGGDTAAANALVDKGSDDLGKALIRSSLADAQIETGDLTGAAETAKELTAPADQIIYLAHLAGHHAKTGDKATARQVLKSATTLAETLKDPAGGYWLGQLTAAMVSSGDVAGALQFSRMQQDPGVRFQALMGVANAMDVETKKK